MTYELLRRAAFVAIACCAAVPLHAQATVPDWASTFGGSGREEVMAVCRGPGELITLVGFTSSNDLPIRRGANPNPLQPALGGGYDAFVARFDPGQPPASQLLWCTYLGGSQDDFALDAEVDPVTGVTSLVGVSRSTDFPAEAGQPAPSLQGLSDGFVAQVDGSGTSLLTSMFVGGTAADHLAAVARDAAGDLFVAGITESHDLPWTAGSAFPSYRGGATDAFVTRLDPGAAPGLRGVWSCYLGGDGQEGAGFSEFANLGGWPVIWEGNLRRLDLRLRRGTDPVLVVSSASSMQPAPTTSGTLSATPAGGDDVYFVQLGPSIQGGQWFQAGFFGGSGDDRPTALATLDAVPRASGFVIGGYTFSSDLPVTGAVQSSLRSCSNCLGWNTDGFVALVEYGRGPSPVNLAYATYLGGDSGEDAVTAVEVEANLHITVAGYASGSGALRYPGTPRSLQETGPLRQFYGTLTRIAPMGRGAVDLLYSTHVGGTAAGWSWLNALALDDRGAVVAAGTTQSLGFPAQRAFQPTRVRGYDGAVVAMPLLPGCVARSEVSSAVAGCSGLPLYTSVGGAPLAGTTFELFATHAPPSAQGVLVFGTPLPPTPIPGAAPASLLVSPLVAVLAPSNSIGVSRVSLALDASVPPTCPLGLGAQWVFQNLPGCPGTGPLANSARLDF